MEGTGNRNNKADPTLRVLTYRVVVAFRVFTLSDSAGPHYVLCLENLPIRVVQALLPRDLTRLTSFGGCD